VSSPLPDLLSTDDLDSYNSGDVDWLNTKVGSVIRGVCRWHVYPSVDVVDLQCRIEANGTIMLPSLQVTAVTNVTVLQPGDGVFTGIALASGQYLWDSAGFIKIIRPLDITGFPFTQIDWQPRNARWATVSFTHGYDVLPAEIAEVGAELITRTQDERQVPSNVTESTAGPFRVSLSESGMVLDVDQIRRLGPYTLVDF
jgi:hypothetical protein